MTTKTKKYIDNYYYEIKRKETNKRNKQNKRRRVIRRCPPHWAYDYPIYKDLKDVIICSDLSKMCPRRWDELEVNFEDKDRRYSSFLDIDINRVTNEYNYNMIKDKNVSIAIPYNGVVHKSLSIELQQYIKEYVFVQISRRIIMNSDYNKQDDINIINKNEAMQLIYLYLKEDIKNSKWKDIHIWIKKYKEYDIDLVEVLNMNGKGGLFND